MSDKKEEKETSVAIAPTVNPADITPNPEDFKPAWKGSLSSDKPIIMPDGHVVLSQEDIDAAKDK